ncbi:MAG: hypothetical protein AAGI37_09195 [Planctomycetota bacterium]
MVAAAASLIYLIQYRQMKQQAGVSFMLRLTLLSVACLAFSSNANAAITFDDFSTLTFAPTTSGSISSQGITLTFTGDNGSIETNLPEGSLNAIALGDVDAFAVVSELTIEFSTPQTEIQIEFDSMSVEFLDSVTTSAGIWTNFPDSLGLSGSTLASEVSVVTGGGSGIDDDLLTTLSFSSPVSQVTFTATGALALDKITVVPEPALGGLALLVIPVLRRTRLYK